MIDRYGPAAVCDALEPLLTPERIARIDQVIDARLASVAAAVEDTYDPHNAAATLRTCEALGLPDRFFGFDSAISEVVNYAKKVDLWMKAGGREQIVRKLHIAGAAA